MTFRHFQYYRENILSNNIRHCENITMIKLSNEKSFDEIDHFFSRSISLYPNLKKLYLYLPNENYLKDLPKIVPNLTELYLIPEKQQLSNIDWLSKMKNLKICSITRMTNSLIPNSITLVLFSSQRSWHRNLEYDVFIIRESFIIKHDSSINL